MRTLIVLTTLVALVSARNSRLVVITNLDELSRDDISNYPESDWYSTSRWLNPFRRLRSSENENGYLYVCSPEFATIDETKVRQTLLTVGTNMDRLSNAIDKHYIEEILEVFGNEGKTMTTQIATIQGAVFAVTQGKPKGGSENFEKGCVSRVHEELKYLLSYFGLLKFVTEHAATEFKQKTSNKAFLQCNKQLIDLWAQVDQFMDDPSQISRLQSACSSVKPSQVIEQVVNTLQTIKSMMRNADDSVKQNSFESTAGLLAQGMTLNAICRAAQNVNETDQVKQSGILRDVKQAQNLSKDLKTIGIYIFGVPGFFRRIFGY